MERTHTKPLNKRQDLPLENGDPSGSDSEPETTEIDTNEAFVAELQRTTAGTIRKQLKQEAKKFYKQQIEKVKKIDWSSNLNACVFVDQRTGGRCTHKACPATDRFWLTGKFKPKRYHGKLCKRHWQTVKQQLIKQGVDLTNESTWNDTKIPSSTFSSRVNTPRYHSTPARPSGPAPLPVAHSAPPPSPVAHSVPLPRPAPRPAPRPYNSAPSTPLREPIKQKPPVARALFPPVDPTEMEYEMEKPAPPSVKDLERKKVSKNQKEARQAKIAQMRGIPLPPDNEKSFREEAEVSATQTNSTDLQREQEFVLAQNLEKVGVNVDISHLNTPIKSDPEQDRKRLIAKERELGINAGELLNSESDCPKDEEQEDVKVVSSSEDEKDNEADDEETEVEEMNVDE